MTSQTSIRAISSARIPTRVSGNWSSSSIVAGHRENRQQSQFFICNCPRRPCVDGSASAQQSTDAEKPVVRNTKVDGPGVEEVNEERCGCLMGLGSRTSVSGSEKRCLRRCRRRCRQSAFLSDTWFRQRFVRTSVSAPSAEFEDRRQRRSDRSCCLSVRSRDSQNSHC